MECGREVSFVYKSWFRRSVSMNSVVYFIRVFKSRV